MNKKEKDKSIAIAYHEATKHSYFSVRNYNYFLNWDIKPSAYKIYDGFTKIKIPKASGSPALSALEAIKKGGYGGTGGVKSIRMLGDLLHLSYGHTAKKTYPGIKYYLRSAPSAGALYPVEVYLTLNGVDGLTDGLYHYTPYDSSLYLLRSGDFRKIISDATAGNDAIPGSDLIIILTTIFWRSSWKYRERAYRYCLLDAGHLAGNILAAGSAYNMGPSITECFVDSDINKLLGINGVQEAAQVIIPFDRGSAGIQLKDKMRVKDIQEIKDPLEYPDEIKSTLIPQIHSASSYRDCTDFIRIVPEIRVEEEEKAGEISPLAMPWKDSITWKGISETILRRRSSRDFKRASMPFLQLSLILHYSFQGYRSDITDDGSLLLDIYLFINGVDNIKPGLYFFKKPEDGLIKMGIRGARERDLREEVAYLCLEQGLCGNAGVVFFFTANIEELIYRYGERIYRSLHLEAGILGESIYLSATALGIGATGIGAFYDDDAADFLNIYTTGGKVIYVMAIGIQEE